MTVILQQSGELPFTVMEDFSLSFVDPYASRIFFAARSGGESANHDIDNLEVQFLN